MEDLSYYSETRHEMLRYLPDCAKSVLDVGCGVGIFGKALIDSKQCVVTGCEPNWAAGVEASRRLHKVFNAPFEDIDFMGNTYDAIFFNDVLEHMIDPLACLKRARKLLSEGGVIISSIPNLRHHAILSDLMLNKNFRYRDSGVLDRTHLRFFTSRTILELHEKAGLQVLRHDGINKTNDKKAKLLATVFPIFEDIVWLQFVTVACVNSSTSSF